MSTFRCVGFADECLEDVPRDDLGRMYELCLAPNLRDVVVSLVMDDYKYHASPMKGHLRYVQYCLGCLEGLSEELIQDDLDEYAKIELRKLHQVDDNEL
jgi:hypothetical protein